MKFAFNTLIYGDNELRVILKDVKAAGYDGIEIFPKDIPGSDGSRPIDPDLIQAVKESGLEVSAYMGGFLSGTEEHTGVVSHACEVAGLLGTGTIFQLAPDKAGGRWDAFIPLLQPLMRLSGGRNTSCAGSLATRIGKSCAS